MSTNTPDQGIPVPDATDLRSSFPTAMSAAIAVIEPRLNARYSSAADRTTRHPSPADGDESFLTDTDKKYVARNTGTVEGFHRALPTPAAAATRTTTISIPTGITGVSGFALTGTGVGMDTEEFDAGGMFSPADSYMTVPAGETGLFMVEGWLEFEASSSGVRIIVLNVLNSAGTSVVKTRKLDKTASSASIPSRVGLTWTTGLTAGQRVQLAAQHSASGAINVTGGSLAVTFQAAT